MPINAFMIWEDGDKPAVGFDSDLMERYKIDDSTTPRHPLWVLLTKSTAEDGWALFLFSANSDRFGVLSSRKAVSTTVVPKPHTASSPTPITDSGGKLVIQVWETFMDGGLGNCAESVEYGKSGVTNTEHKFSCSFLSSIKQNSRWMWWKRYVVNAAFKWVGMLRRMLVVENSALESYEILKLPTVRFRKRHQWCCSVLSRFIKILSFPQNIIFLNICHSCLNYEKYILIACKKTWFLALFPYSFTIFVSLKYLF